MDAVISFVDMNDIEWQKLYYFYIQRNINASRFRDWGFLRYVLRGIQYNMSFIENVYLILMQESQIPSWLNVNADNLHIVYHRDFIPKKYLPTFNSNTIELHLHKIPGLGERFLYINDDMIPIQPSKEEDYFRDDKIVMDFIKLPCWTGMSTGFYNICLNSENAAREIVGLPPMDGTKFVYRPYHTFSPMFKSVNKYVNSKLNHHWFTDTCTQKRSQRNLTQYLYIDYLFHIGRCITEVPSFKHIYHPLKDDPTTPRRYVDLLGSLMDLTSGSGDKGTPVVWIQNYFDNYSTE